LINPAIELSGGRAIFQVGDNNPFSEMQEGNVILALKNASGGIEWTWHIWITDEPKEITYPNSAGNRKFLDRNIGALSATMVSTGIDNFGFVYQWGRKDPFFGGNGLNNEKASESPLLIARQHTLVSSGYSWNRQPTTSTDDYAKRNPMIFIANPTTSTNLESPVDWLTSSDQNRWHDTQKTDNDPCPAGYKVPNRDDLDSVYKAPKPPDNLSYYYFRYIDHWRWDFYRQGVTETATSWPATGKRQGRNNYGGNAGSNLIHSGTAATRGVCYYWTSSAVKIANMTGGAYRLRTSADNLYGQDAPGLYSRDDFGDKADACPIRCVKITP
jgi:hypothetical protein